MTGKQSIVTGLALALFATAVAALDASTPPASFETLDTNKDGRISVSEARKDKAVSGSFASADTNQDGYLDKKEFEAVARK